jgi:transcriptional regulator with XRE-family HTH domain
LTDPRWRSSAKRRRSIDGMDDLRVGRIVRVLRQRKGLRQSDVATRVKTAQDVISRIERGRIDTMSLRRLRAVLAEFDAELGVFVRWRGGELDRVLDARHAAIVEHTLERLHAAAWVAQPEVSFSRYGERGSIDALAWHARSQTLLVVEVKTELTSIEETLRRHDAKARLAADIARERFEWRAQRVARLLVLPEHRTARRESTSTRRRSSEPIHFAGSSFGGGSLIRAAQLIGRVPAQARLERAPEWQAARPGASCFCQITAE